MTYLWDMRKKWTPKTEVTESDVQFREKRKWQIALRRYVLEGNKSLAYAPFFGLDHQSFRQWIALQFDNELNWDNFSSHWQFDHIVPVAYFNFKDEADMKLCWNFTNITVEKCGLNKNKGNRVDVLAARAYFQELFQKTQYPVCEDMLNKIEQIEISQIRSNTMLENFLVEKKEYLKTISNYTSYEYEKLNSGVSLESIEAERKFLEKYK
ncbi:MAG TPA: hypothetical protein VD996_06790 [Chitinophagaceae bacterium]|nr:hypothetical protein [Chitinophagaceae bacterium]